SIRAEAGHRHRRQSVRPLLPLDASGDKSRNPYRRPVLDGPGVELCEAFGTSWRPVYLIGGLAPIVVAPLLATLLPTDAKVARQPKGKGERGRLGALAGLFGEGRAATTLFLWLATFGTLLIMYLLLGWMPSLLVQMGLTRQDAQYVQMIYNLGSAIGAALA